MTPAASLGCLPRVAPRGGSLPTLGPSACQGAESGWVESRGSVLDWCLAAHRASQSGKVLACKLDHIPHPQDGAERGLVRVEAARLHVGGRQVGKEVSSGEEQRREAGRRS